MKLYEIIKKTNELTSKQKIPSYNISALLGCLGKSVFSISGEDICLNCTDDSDYGSVEEWRKVVEYLANEFGGDVNWIKEKNKEENNV